jgi:uncharacterized protein YdhG (YjbR/CyaY superfamily)
MAKAPDIDSYIATFPPEVQPLLEDVRTTMRRAAPGTAEGVSYGIPALNLDGRYLVYFAGWKHHISVYPVPGGDPAFEARLAPYATGKGTLQFPLDKPIPLDLIADVAATLLAQRRAEPA